ncbi:MAG: PQQ-binding-like beta-propeller repeat protein [Bryobacteraceae bacterium]
MCTRTLLAVLFASTMYAANWPHWRGPTADGLSPETAPPVEWSATRNIAWRTPLPGLGTSTPILWGDRIFITSQIGDGPFEQRGRDFENSGVVPRKTGERKAVQFAVHAFSRAGRLLWEHRFDADGPLQAVHMKHNLASPSCVTDGEFVYAWFGTGQLLAFSLDGKLVWQRHLGREIGPFEILWGHGSSPALYKDSLILLCDHQGAAYIVSLDKRTGRQRWKVERGKDRRSYSTPFVVKGPRGDELIVNSSERIDALDPSTGEPLWHTGEPNRVPIGMPVFHNGVLYASRGYSSGPYMALRPGGRGDISSTHVNWLVPTGAPYVSSLLYYQGVIYMANETGIASAIDAATGKLLWRERLGGVFSASPVAAAGRVIFINEAGQAFVVQAGKELKILARNSIPERTLASPVIADGRIYLRTDESLIAIASQ